MRLPYSTRMKRLLYFGIFVWSFFAIVLAFRLKERFSSETLKVTFWDIGQGDSILMEFPKGKTLLIDSGGGNPHWTQGRPILSELRSKGILNLDAVLLTHPDSDHILGFTELVDQMGIKEYWLNPVFMDDKIVPLLWKLIWQFKEQKVKPIFFGKAEKRNWDGVELTFLPARGASENDQCVVLLAEFQGCRILMTGDIEKDSERELKDKLNSSVHLFKVAHHGSKTSSTKDFLRKVDPKWSVISVGWANRYGHPKDFVTERLRALGSEVFRTDWHGFVEFTIQKNGKIQCRTARGDCGTSECHSLSDDLKSHMPAF